MTAPPEVTYRHLELGDAEAAARLERICHPTLSDDGLLLADEVAVHVRTFHDGNWVAVADEEIIGISLTWRIDFDLDNPQHRLVDIDKPELHRDDAPWLYGLDTSIHPDFRGRGIGGGFYELRRQYVIKNKMRGIVAGGMLPGYAGLENTISAEEFIDDVIAGRRRGPTLSFQLSQGFTVRGLLPGYIDGAVGDVATLIVWEPEAD